MIEAENTKADLDRNPSVMEMKIERQKEKERHGRFVRVPVPKLTYIFVRDGEDEQERINAHLEKMANRQKMWN